MDKQKGLIEDRSKIWELFFIVMIPVVAAWIFSLYINNKYANIRVDDENYLHEVKLILTANTLSFLAFSLCIAVIFSPLVHLFWNPDSIIRKRFYDKAQMRFYHLESVVIVIILMLPSMFLVNLSKKYDLDYYCSAFDQMRILVGINKNIKGESEIIEKSFDEAPYFSDVPKDKEIGVESGLILTTIGKDGKNEKDRLLIPHNEEDGAFKFKKGHYKIRYYTDTGIIASIETLSEVKEPELDIQVKDEKDSELDIQIKEEKDSELDIQIKLEMREDDNCNNYIFVSRPKMPKYDDPYKFSPKDKIYFLIKKDGEILDKYVPKIYPTHTICSAYHTDGYGDYEITLVHYKESDSGSGYYSAISNTIYFTCDENTFDEDVEWYDAKINYKSVPLGEKPDVKKSDETTSETEK